jgi:hypothetical protein
MPPHPNLAALREELLAERAIIEAELGIPTGAAAALVTRAAPRKRRRSPSAPSAQPPAPPTRVSLRVRGVQAASGATASGADADAGVGAGNDAADYALPPARGRQRRGDDELPPRLGRPSSAAAVARRAERAAAAAGSAADVLVVPPSSAVAVADGAAVPLRASTLLKATVLRDTQIRAFVEGNLGVPFFAGRSYHEFVERTSVYTTEAWVIENTLSGDVFEGVEAFRAAGFSRVAKARAPPQLPAHMRLYLLSRSHGRMLRKGQRFIYKIVDG